MSKEVANRKYQLVGFMNMFEIVPDFVSPVFQCLDDSLFYFQHGNEETLEITDFDPISKRCTGKIIFLGDAVKSNYFSETEISLDSRPIFAFQVSDDFVQVGYYEDIRKFIETYETDDKVLKEQINDFLSVTGSKALDIMHTKVEFNFYLNYIGLSAYKSWIYEVYVKADKEYILLGKCYVRPRTFHGKVKPVEIFPKLSSYYRMENNLEEVLIKKLANQIASIVYERMKNHLTE